MRVHKIGFNGTMYTFSQSVVKPILIYCYNLDSVEYHNIGMIYINAITPAYKKKLAAAVWRPLIFISRAVWLTGERTC
jgi:hypothetical protein